MYTLAESSRGPTTTELVQEVSLGDGDQEPQIAFMDTPGLTFPQHSLVHYEEDDEEGQHDIEMSRAVMKFLRAQDILLRNKGRIDRLKDPQPPGGLLSI